MLSGNTTTSNDRNVESGWVAVAVPMNVPCLMSAIDDLTTAIARNLSANIIATSVPSFACTTSLGPSMLTTVPRTRTASPSARTGPLLIAIGTRTAATADARRPNPYGCVIRSSHAYELLAHSPKVTQPRRLLGPVRTRVSRHPHRAQRASTDITKITGPR